MLPVSKQVAMDVLKSTNGTFFSVSFVKRGDGSIRKMLCRTGVKKYTTGEGLKYDPIEKGLLPVWEINKGYKMVPLSNVICFNAHGQEFFVPSTPVVI
jgi:hypothetical protein